MIEESGTPSSPSGALATQSGALASQSGALASRRLNVQASSPAGGGAPPIRGRLAFTLLAVAGILTLAHGLWIPAKAQLSQVLLRAAWQRTLDGDPTAKPWPWADTRPVARIVIPRTGSDYIVLAGSDGRALAFAPGHLEQTASPGEGGNCVLTAHRDTHFAALRNLRPGDPIRLQRPDGNWFTYRVKGHKVINESDTFVTRATGGATLTLITCYPFDAIRAGGRERYVVMAALAG